jgi:hypothetical protein
MTAKPTARPTATKRPTLSTRGELRDLVETLRHLPDDAAIKMNVADRPAGSVLYWPDLHQDVGMGGRVLGYMVCFDVDQRGRS